MKTIAFIDNFIETPINHCVNEFILRNNMPCSYHQPARFGFDSLNRLERVDGIVLLGSASHVTTPEPWHSELINFISPYFEKQLPILGICFGHQLIAHHFGCKIDYIDEEQTYFQLVREIHFESNLWGQTFDKRFLMPYSHKQAVKEISDQFEIIASCPGLLYEGLKHKKYNLWTFQGHPESSTTFLKETLKIEDEEELKKIKLMGNTLLDAFAKFV